MDFFDSCVKFVSLHTETLFFQVKKEHQMETKLYHYALCVSLTLMLFFSYRFIFGVCQTASYTVPTDSRVV